MKDFFFFSKSQRIGILLLVILIVIVLVASCLLPRFSDRSNADRLATEQFQEEVAAFEQSLADLPKRTGTNFGTASGKANDKTQQSSRLQHYALFPFDPNTADSATFVQLGLPSYVAGNILKYRAKGGTFRKAADFARIYGISDEKFAELEPFIQLKSVESQPQERPLPADTTARPKPVSNKKDTVLELNTADTTSLQLIRGIGRRYALNIVRYRESLGGFYSVEQLREVSGMTEENYLRIKDSFTVDTLRIVPLNVNRASVEKLKRHPYLSFTQAKAIYELRRLKIKLSGMEQLRTLDELTEDDLRRLRPYLSFEK